MTEMVLEEVSGDEGDTPQKATAVPPAKLKQAPQAGKKTPVAKDTKASTNAPKPQQKSMMSFFTKK